LKELAGDGAGGRGFYGANDGLACGPVDFKDSWSLGVGCALKCDCVVTNCCYGKGICGEVVDNFKDGVGEVEAYTAKHSPYDKDEDEKAHEHEFDEAALGALFLGWWRSDWRIIFLCVHVLFLL
jgi:hypothetical protein